MVTISKENYYIMLTSSDSCVYVEGRFGEIGISRTPITGLLLRRTADANETRISEGFGRVAIMPEGDCVTVSLSEPAGIPGIAVIVRCAADETGVSWQVDVANDSEEYSVMEVSYPMPAVYAGYFDLFQPGSCGRVTKDAGRKNIADERYYPEHLMCMPYFAVYGKNNGIYFAVEDERAAVKRFTVSTDDGKALFTADFLGINATRPHNSFSAYGRARWQYFKGDWYDATLIYAGFVHKYASWLPPVGKDGRPDTPDKYKDIPFWVSDYIPNSARQGGNMPMVLGYGSDSVPENYWYDAVIKLQKELNVPIGYHVYNWHEIPFNIEYPHFWPPKAAFRKGLAELKKHSVYVMPYINGVSWETRDGDAGHECSFEKTGIHGGTLDKNGRLVTEEYPQTTVSGHTSQLAPICPSFETWRTEMERLTRRMENELDIDGIYYDQVAACRAYDCYNGEHDHLPGGGSHWVENYNRMMRKIRYGKTRESFYFTECNAEPYIGSFDGVLTWMWAQNGEVPAFPAVYAGYVQTIGRFYGGRMRDNYTYFKYATARSLLYGQQLGWCKADVLYKPEWLKYLKRMVSIRYRYSEFFRSARMLRPPRITKGLPPVTAGPVFAFEKEPLVMEQLSAAAWKSCDGRKTVIFLASIADTDVEFTLSIPAAEYVSDGLYLPSDFSVCGEVCSVSGTIEPDGCRIWELCADGQSV